MSTLKFPLRKWSASLALALSVAGCTDDRPSITAPDAVVPVSAISVSDDGVISASVDLPFDPDDGSSLPWWGWGRFPEHEELTIPAGPHVVEFEVSGGVRFVRKPDVDPWAIVDFLDTVYIGIGGVPSSFDEPLPALRLQMGYINAQYEESAYAPLYAWQAEPFATGSARGRVVLTGPGRIVFNRHYNSGWWGGLAVWLRERPAFQYYDWISDQRVTMTIRPLARKLDLECIGDLGLNRVTRGRDVRCQVSAGGGGNAGGDIVVEEWWFEGLDSRGTPFRYPTADDPPEKALSWGGRMLISGTVNVRAKVGSQPVESASAQITVEGRDWSTQVATYQIGRITLAHFNTIVRAIEQIPILPAADHHLGAFVVGGEILGSRDGVLDYASDYGPNHGLAFYSRVPVALTLGIMVHPEMENQGQFWARHPVRSSSRECERGDFPRFVAQILHHEGLPVNPQSHSGVFLREFQPRVGPALEDIVIPDVMRDSMVAEAQTRTQSLVTQADAISDAEVDTTHRVPFGCNFKWR